MNTEYFLREYAGEVYSSSDLEEILGNRVRISSLTREGLISKISRGFYSVGNLDPYKEVYSLISKYYPQSVIIGHSALFLNGLSQFDPECVQLGVDNGKGALADNDLIEFYRLAESRLSSTHVLNIHGQNISVLTPVRSVISVMGSGGDGELYQKAIGLLFKNGYDNNELEDLSSTFPKEVNKIRLDISLLEHIICKY